MGISPIGEMSALRKLKRRFVLETRPDDNFIKTAAVSEGGTNRRRRPRPEGRRCFAGYLAVDFSYPPMMLI